MLWHPNQLLRFDHHNRTLHQRPTTPPIHHNSAQQEMTEWMMRRLAMKMQWQMILRLLTAQGEIIVV
jgi:hypothetical protein